MAPRPKKMGRRYPLDEHLKYRIDLLLASFQRDDSSNEYKFPPDLTIEERAYVYESCQKKGMKSKSYGSGDKRFVTVTKVHKKRPKEQSIRLKLLPQTLDSSSRLLRDLPLTPAELRDSVPLEKQAVGYNTGSSNQYHADCISSYVPTIPPKLKCPSLLEERKKLPTWSHREEILDMIARNQVIMVSGDTGSGKTTQVPQYIMELASEKKEPVRIICTQPRRIAAMSVAERVASERGERLGSTVGYQIRLENRMSSSTALVFCTTGILLRTLMYHDSNLDKVTHLIIDEVHERDRFVDFLLGVLRSRISRFPNLRIILMSAALDVNVFSDYFGTCPVLHVQGKCFPVEEHFLEDVLRLTNYGHIRDAVERRNPLEATAAAAAMNQSRKKSQSPPAFDSWLEKVFIEGSERTLEMMSEAVTQCTMPPNYQHSLTKLTPLMVAAGRGRGDIVENLLKAGADPSIEAGQWSAANLARQMKHYELADKLEVQCRQRGELAANQAQQLLQMYKDRWDEEIINVELILDILHWIDQQNDKGAVLIFLSGYQEIMDIRHQIMYNDPRFASSNRHEIFTLHSCMQSDDQRRVFCRLPNGKRKIVLATNLAETSITIDDIVYVIDTGKVKVKSYDALTGVSALQSEWVSQASAIQRKGRAGRCQKGMCFHLFSRERFQRFEAYQIPEIFRVALDELCLQSKTLAPSNMSIVEFISSVPEPPSPLAVQRAVTMLQWIDALDPWENVTDLGRLLLELPVEARLGKMLLTATVLRCLDPVLTIVCSLSHRSPFVLPAEADEKKLAASRKLELAAGTLSDHMVMLRAYNLWQAAKNIGKGFQFCRKYFLSSPTLEVVHQLRVQILNQLRKSGFLRSMEELSTNANSWVAIKASILSGLYPQVGLVASSGNVSTRREPVVKLHQSSAVRGSQKNCVTNLPTKWLIYEQISRSSGLLATIKLCTLVTPIALALFGGHSRLPLDAIKEAPIKKSRGRFPNYDSDSDDVDTNDCSDCSSEELDEETMKELSEGLDDLVLAEQFSRPMADRDSVAKKEKSVTDKHKNSSAPKTMCDLHLDDWICFRMNSQSAHQLFSLRQKWQALFARRLRNPIAPDVEGDAEVLDAILDILAKEEEASGLPPCPEFLSPKDLTDNGPKKTSANASWNARNRNPAGGWRAPERNFYEGAAAAASTASTADNWRPKFDGEAKNWKGNRGGPNNWQSRQNNVQYRQGDQTVPHHYITTAPSGNMKGYAFQQPDYHQGNRPSPPQFFNGETVNGQPKREKRRHRRPANNIAANVPQTY